MMHIWPVVRPVVLLLVVTHLSACGDSPAERTRTETERSPHALQAEMDSAKGYLRIGEVEKAEAFGWTVYKQAQSDPALAKQQLNALALLGRVMQRRMLNDSALSLYREGLDLALAIEDTAAPRPRRHSRGAAPVRCAQYG